MTLSEETTTTATTAEIKKQKTKTKPMEKKRYETNEKKNQIKYKKK